MVAILNLIGYGGRIANAQFVIKDINVIPMTSSTGLLKNQMVVISGGKIIYIGKPRKLLDNELGFKKVLGKGRYLIPGLCDMHCHFPDSSKLQEYYTLNLMAGVTTLRSMRGQELPAQFYRSRQYPSPNALLSGIVTDRMNLDEWKMDSLLSAYKKEGLDFIKVLSIRDSLTFELLMNSASPLAMPVCGHFLKTVGNENLVKSGFRSIEHLGGQEDALRADSSSYVNLLKLMSKTGIFHCPTLDWFRISYGYHDVEELRSRAGMSLISDSLKLIWTKAHLKSVTEKGAEKLSKQRIWYQNLWGSQKEILKLMHEEKVKVLIGLDAGEDFSIPGFAMIEEMKLLKEIGFSNYEILKCASVNAAECLDQANRFGKMQTLSF